MSRTPAATSTGRDEEELLDAEEARTRLRWHGVQLVLLGLVGLGAALALTLERLRLFEDSSYVPACDLSPVLSCGSVMVTDQASLLGFPNPLIGLMAFPVLLALGAVQLGGTRLPRPVEAGVAVGGLAGWAFVHWLVFQSLYRIQALCPWCMVVWVAVAPLALWALLRPWRDGGSRPARALWSARWLLVGAWYLTVVLLALVQFWSYWRTLL